MYFFELFLFVGVVNAGHLSLEPINEGKIFGGQDAKDGDAPWQVAIQKPLNRTFLCGGSILNKHWVVTSASCIGNTSAAFLKVRYNTLKLGGGFTLFVTKVIKHENYSEYPRDYDIALVRTLGIIFPGRKNSNPIKLPEKDETKTNGTQITISGWGTYTNGSEEYSQNLKLGKLTISDQTKCKQIYSNEIIDRMFCAKDDKSKVYSGKGDDGGPASKDKTLIGILITQYHKCNEYDIFTNVYQFVSWIKKHIN